MKEITLLGRRIKVKNVSQAELRDVYPESDEEVHAWYSPIEYTVYMYAGLEEQAYKRVLLHEIMHALLHISGLTNCLKEAHEEAVCDVAENMLELFQNKKFVEEMSK